MAPLNMTIDGYDLLGLFMYACNNYELRAYFSWSVYASMIVHLLVILMNLTSGFN